MLLTLVKNNVKLILRSKISFMFMCVLPIILILILSNAFSSSLGRMVELEEFMVGYSIEAESSIANYFPTFKEQFEENGIILKPMSQKEGLKAVADEEIVSYLTLDDTQYTLYNKEGVDINGMVFESSFKSGMYLYDGLKMIIPYMMENQIIPTKEIISEMESLGSREPISYVKKHRIEVEPVARAQDYYGITEIVFIIWFGVSSVVGLTNDERKYKISERIRLTNVKPIVLFMGKFIPNVLGTCVQVGIAIGVSTLLLKVNWGEHLFLSGGILLLEVIAVSALGTMLTIIIKSSLFINMIMYISAFVFGFMGGSFQDYMHNFLSEDMVRWSPLYYLNRTLVELSTKGSSDYLGATFMMLLAITIASVTIGLTYMYARREA
ncbi:MAG TPA: ABC transporter permease [Epulopiscium sp.]|nr:ABC transporter permease [Candidatus Epulonipiscium sp.]